MQFTETAGSSSGIGGCCNSQCKIRWTHYGQARPHTQVEIDDMRMVGGNVTATASTKERFALRSPEMTFATGSRQDKNDSENRPADLW